MIKQTQISKNIVVFDSSCLVCNNFIQYVHKIDIHNNFLFTNFESNFVNKMNINFDKKTIHLLTSNGTKFKSEAILEIFGILKSHTVIIKIIKVFPIRFRDFFYDLFSKNRLLFGTNQQNCSIDLKDKILQ
jgi:predicted DCC family thiol-disulfide oxidoreductase YuxK